MNEKDELRDLWSSQPSTLNTKGEEVMAQVQSRIQKFDRMVRRRNLIETPASVLVGLIFGIQALHAHDVLVRSGSLVIAGGSAWIIFWLWRYGQPPADADPSLPITAYTRKLIARCDQQIRLLRSVKFWYLLPFYIGLMLISFGGFLAQRASGTLGLGTYLLPAIYTLIFAAIWWANEIHAVGWLRRERARLVSITSEESA